MADARVLGPHDPGSRRTLITPEGVDLSLGLARIGQRAGALLIDLAFMYLCLQALIIVLFLAIGTASEEMIQFGQELVLVILLLGFFLLRNGYFILFEGGRRAATWGKRIMKLRVVARSGERLTFDSVVARNLMREIEFYLPLTYIVHSANSDMESGWAVLGASAWILIFLLFPLFNRDRLRVGDLLAGTWVVMIPRRQLGYDLLDAPAESAIQFTPEQLDTYGVFELQTLEQVLREERWETIQMVAGTIREKIGYWGPGDDHEFLAAYYAAARARMERGLLLGKRRADKYDRSG